MKTWLMGPILTLALCFAGAGIASADHEYGYQHCCNCVYVSGWTEYQTETVCIRQGYHQPYVVYDCGGGYHYEYRWVPPVYTTRLNMIWHPGSWHCCR